MKIKDIYGYIIELGDVVEVYNFNKDLITTHKVECLRDFSNCENIELMEYGKRLYNGDALIILKELIEKGIKVDAVISDIPYGTTACSWDEVLELPKMWKLLNEIVRDENTPIVLFGQQPFTSKLISSNIDNYKYTWYYKKRIASNFASAKYQPMKHIEEVNVFTKNGKRANYFPIKQPRSESGKKRLESPYHTNSETDNETMGNMRRNNANVEYDKDLKYPENIQEFNKRSKGSRGLHPTQKPVELMEYLIKSHTQKGDVVLDITMGSGTTGVACNNTDRRFIGIELDKEYFNIAKERINEKE